MPIVVEHLTYYYSKGGPFEKMALNDVTFSIADGDFIGLIGHTGSGKSTLIQHLNGLLKADGGTVLVDGVDITQKGVKLADVRQKVGLVFQYPEHQLFEETVYKDIAFGPGNLGLEKDEIDKRVHEAAEMVGLEEKLLEKSPFDLSGGQKRRVAIAGVLAMQPQVLILDEPTAGLDPVGRDEILSRIKWLHDKQGITVILVSHSMEDVAKTVQKVMVMAGGKLQFFDTVPNVFRHAESLKKLGLAVPQASDVMAVLRQRGLPVSDEVFTVDGAVKEILRYLNEVGKC